MPRITYNQRDATSADAVRAVFAASIPHDLTGGLIERAYQTWKNALRSHALRTWDIDWDIENNVAVSTVEAPDRVIAKRLHDTMHAVPVIPADRTFIPPEGWR